LDSEERINSIELEIDALAVDLLALHQPMASNLRFIIAALKINSNLERMGDLSVLFRGCAMKTVRPIELFDWTDIFHVAWIDEKDKAK
jgi:hypothetical protein